MDLMLTPAVIAMRMPLLLAESRDTSHQPKEAMLAVTEKAVAIGEGMVAAQMSLASSAFDYWARAMTGRAVSASGAPLERAMTAALTPMARAVRRNHSRLSKL